MRAKKLEKKGKGNQRKAVSNVITVVLLVMVVILLMIVIWNVIKLQIKNAQDDNDVRTQLLVEQATIDYADLSNPNMVNITITKGSGKIVLVNESIIKSSGDIVFLIDTTGSMGSEIIGVKDTIKQFSDKLNESGVDFRLALVEFKDYPISPCGSLGDFPSKIHSFAGEKFTNNVTLFKDEVSTNLNAKGGADTSESHLTAINDSLSLPFRSDAKKFFILLTDAPPHAKDCECGSLYSQFANSCNQPPHNTYAPECSSGIENVSEVEKKLIDAYVKYYEINKENYTSSGQNGVCDNNITKKMAINTGGGFYSYTESGGVADLIKGLADEIIKIYDEEKKIAYVQVMFYDLNGKSWEYRILGSDAPGPLETRTYSINMTGSELGKIEKIKIYPVAVTESGKYVTGPVLDVINFD